MGLWSNPGKIPDTSLEGDIHVEPRNGSQHPLALKCGAIGRCGPKIRSAQICSEDIEIEGKVVRRQKGTDGQTCTTEAAPLKCRAVAQATLHPGDDHRGGISGGLKTPFSVIRAVTFSSGVASKAGL
ncbi:MAG: hypothetical protein A4E45_01238 [Methanosaeta sp. PtaB.Bin039]|nr:MAG: hypothetical protein A4E45_01238 [Methanosaeta sp. PtaB.Bin039]